MPVVISILVLLTSLFWLHWLAVRDGYVSDPWLLLTGISVVTYSIREWNKAKWPIAAGFAAIAALVLAR